MKLTIAAIPVVLGRFTLVLPAPGIVYHVAFESKRSLVMRAGVPDFEENPVLFAAVSPGSPVRTRTFVVLKQGETIDVPDGEAAQWRATNISGKGLVVHVYEIMEAAS